MSIDGIAQWRQKPSVAHAGATVFPKDTRRVHSFLGHGDVGGTTEKGQPKIFNGQVRPEGLGQGPVEILASEHGCDWVGHIE